MPLRKYKILEAAVQPQLPNGSYTVSYIFEDGIAGFDPGLTKEEAYRRAARVGEYEEMIDEQDAD